MQNKVSILILLDVVLEALTFNPIDEEHWSFNPYFVGCGSGSRTVYYQLVFQYHISYLEWYVFHFSVCQRTALFEFL